MTNRPVVDVIIPIHDLTRPLPRTLASIARSGLTIPHDIRINVVAHNVAAAQVRALLDPDVAERARFFECMDGWPSPAGPRTLALSHADAQYVSFVDSDDLLEDGAIAAWVRLAERYRLDAVIPRERHADGRRIRTPVMRPWRRGDLDPVRDRLAYRTAPLGLIRTDAITRLKLEFATEVRNGSDQIFALKLWFGASKVRYAGNAPAYVVSSDADTRVSTQTQPLGDALWAPQMVLTGDWFANLTLRERRAIAVKLTRVHFMEGVSRRLSEGSWNHESLASAQSFLGVAREAAVGFERFLSIADNRLCQAILTQAALGKLTELARRRRSFGTPGTIFTPNMRDLLHPQAPLRFMTASVLHR